MKKISAFAPGSVSNVACGFDIFGFAIEEIGDIVTAQISNTPGIKITKISGDQGRLPYDPEKNTAGIAVQSFLQKTGCNDGVELEIKKQMPFSSGLGSSAASPAAAVVAVNKLFDEPLSKKELLSCVIEAEKSISGSIHADNAAPALLGGFIAVRSAEEADVISVPVPENLFYSVIYPLVEINTLQARQALPKVIPLSMAIKHWANTAILIQAMNSADFELLARSMEDFLAEPVRSQWIPHYAKVKSTALANGAFACNISGSGPSIFTFCDSMENAKNAAREMKKIYDKYQITSIPYSGKIRKTGAEIIE